MPAVPILTACASSGMMLVRGSGPTEGRVRLDRGSVVGYIGPLPRLHLNNWIVEGNEAIT